MIFQKLQVRFEKNPTVNFSNALFYFLIRDMLFFKHSPVIVIKHLSKIMFIQNPIVLVSKP
jgi:hypothetical protein